MKTAIYARVSTVGLGQSTAMQLRDLRLLAERRGFEIVREYIDEGFSGARDSRPALDEMRADAKRGKFCVLLVWRLDRLGRSLAGLVRLLDDFRAQSVELISFSEGLDFTTSHGKLMFQLLSAFSEFEREVIRERVLAGLRNARARGIVLGRRRVPVDAARIAKLRAQGASWRVVCERTGLSKGTAQRAVYSLPKNPHVPTTHNSASGVSPVIEAAQNAQ
jgi:DNA invertase Pin-like site-specific DNA recombinase